MTAIERPRPSRPGLRTTDRPMAACPPSLRRATMSGEAAEGEANEAGGVGAGGVSGGCGAGWSLCTQPVGVNPWGKAMEMKPQVTVRSVEQAHAEAIQKYASDAKIADTCNVPHPYPKDGGKAFVEGALRDREAGTRYVFAILYDGGFAGVMGLNSVDTANGTASLDYWVAVPFWNRGVATAAAAQVIGFAFQKLGLRQLHSSCLARNWSEPLS